VRELEREIERLKEWSTEQELYTRTEIAKGFYALLEIDSPGDVARDFESAIKLCDACFARDVKSPLTQYINADGRRILVCKNCGEFEVPKYLDTDRQVANDVS
jgi:hypothetical protein